MFLRTIPLSDNSEIKISFNEEKAITVITIGCKSADTSNDLVVNLNKEQTTKTRDALSIALLQMWNVAV